MINKLSTKFQVWFASFLIWLFHISAMIGITMGHKDWFLEKTPLNLSLSLVLFFWIFPINTMKRALLFVLFFGMGMLAEWLGVTYGLLFGEYEYGEALGPKLDGVPWLIGCYWGLLAFITYEIAKYKSIPIWLQLCIGAGLMVLLDFFMEINAPNFDFWTFNGEVPLKNYVTWFVIGLSMQLLLKRFHITGNKTISYHLYTAQLLFFIYFSLINV